MSFALASAAALGLLVVALGPVVAHLARQTPVDRQPFGAMMLVRRMVKQLRRRRRIRDPFLLLLRMLALASLAFAATRPEVRLPETSLRYGGSRRVVVIVDNSLSMSYAGGNKGAEGSSSTLLERAREQAASQVRDLPEGTEVAAFSTAAPRRGEQPGPTRLTPTFSTDRSAVASLVETLEPSFEGTDLGGALRQARSLLDGRPGEVFVYGDEAGPAVVAGAEPELRRLYEAGASVLPRVVRNDPERNLAPVFASYGDGVEGGSIRVIVAGFGPGESEATVTVTLPDQSEMTAFVSVPGCDEDVPAAPPENQAFGAKTEGSGPETPASGPETPASGPPPGDPAHQAACGQAETVFTVPPEVQGGVAEVSVADAGLVDDDDRFFHLPRVGASKVLVVDGDPGPTPIASEVYFLERALAPWGALRTGITPEVVAPSGVSDLDLSAFRVIWLANVADPKPISASLSDFVRRGGGLVIASGDNLSPERYNGALAPLLPSPLRKLRNLVDLSAEGGVPLQAPDTSIDLFRPFSRAGRSGFTRIFLRRAATLEPYEDSSEVHTLLTLVGGVPFLVERQVGRGHVLFLAGTLDLAWGNFPLEAVFTPFVQRVVSWLGGESGGDVARFAGTVGETVSVALPDAALAPELRGPGDIPFPSTLSGNHLLFVPDRPGAYAVMVAGAPPLALVAVNTPAAESDIRRFGSLSAAEARIDPARFKRTIAVGPWMAALGLFLLLSQAVWAFRRAPIRRRMEAES